MDAAEESELRKFIGDHTGGYASAMPHSFLICCMERSGTNVSNIALPPRRSEY